ncbi:VirB3 family type IV secretion system protein [Mesorhizobium sp.]|uniref:VirB3 family type IV secretion system protein n=1 Tax=Mesorhizobium sp. TaxID=1871066 RepID=UPI00268E92FF
MSDRLEDKAQLTPLVIGLTRPPMMWGIPLNAFYIIVGMTLIAFSGDQQFLGSGNRARDLPCPVCALQP